MPNNAGIKCCQNQQGGTCVDKVCRTVQFSHVVKRIYQIDGTHVLIMTQNCQLKSQQSDSKILAFYRNFLLRVDKDLYKNDDFKNVLRKVFIFNFSAIISFANKNLRFFENLAKKGN